MQTPSSTATPAQPIYIYQLLPKSCNEILGSIYKVSRAAFSNYPGTTILMAGMIPYAMFSGKMAFITLPIVWVAENVLNRMQKTVPAEKFDTTRIRRCQLPEDGKITDLFTMTRLEIMQIVTELNARYQAIEKGDHPAAGYELYFKVISTGKRPMEFFLDAVGERKKGTEMSMPQIKGNNGCAFCNNDLTGSYEGLLNAKVMTSLEGNPLAISSRHARHFFELHVEEQTDIVLVAAKVLNVRTNGKCSRYQLSTHIGTEGHQTYPHMHMHIAAALGKKE